MKGSLPVRIVGGGMTGLTLAYKLARRGVAVVVHERDPYLGGLAAEGNLGGVPVERYYHCVLPTDSALLDLFGELHLSDQVGWTKTRTGFFHERQLLEMTSAADFARFPAITRIDRLRLAWTIAYCGYVANWKTLDREPISTFLRRHGGERLFRSIWEPLLMAKLGQDYDRFAASFIWATVFRMLSARRAKGHSEKLGFVKGRYGKVFQALRREIEQLGGEVRVGETVTGMDHGGEEWSVVVGEKRLPASSVVLTVPAPFAAEWVRPFLPEAAAALDRVEYLGVICEVLLLRRSLTPYYVLNLTDKSLPFTGVIETSNLTGTKEFSGHSLVYIPRYRDQQSPTWNQSDEEIHVETVAGLRKIVPDLVEADVEAWQVNRARFVQPVHPVGWAEMIPRVELAERVHYLATAQIHPWPVFNDEVVRHVDRSLSEILSFIERRSGHNPARSLVAS